MARITVNQHLNISRTLDSVSTDLGHLDRIADGLPSGWAARAYLTDALGMVDSARQALAEIAATDHPNVVCVNPVRSTVPSTPSLTVRHVTAVVSTDELSAQPVRLARCVEDVCDSIDRVVNTLCHTAPCAVLLRDDVKTATSHLIGALHATEQSRELLVSALNSAFEDLMNAAFGQDSANLIGA